jgi:5-methylcytosine-specific restriction endonuclease McrA
VFWKAKAKPIIHRRAVPTSVKTAVLNRDGWRCQLCGLKAERSKRALLHVDHRVALANGGTNDISNLWTLCAPCNLSKGKKVLTFRRQNLTGKFYTWATGLSVLALLVALLLHH